MEQADVRKDQLTPMQIKMLEKMLEWDSEYSYPYYYFDDLAPQKVLSKEMKGLRELGYVRMCRGGLDDYDGTLIGGTSFIIEWSKRQEIKNLIAKYYENL